MHDKKQRLYFLDNLRAIAILMVVIIHAISYSSNLSSEFTSLVLKATVMVAVPLFFFVDGYLLPASISNNKDNSYKNVVVKSAYRLLLPWVIFSLTYLVIRYFFERFGYLDDYLIVGKSASDIALFSYGSVYAGQMYFLLSLFFIRLCIPVIAKLFVELDVHYSIVIYISMLVLYKTFSSSIYSFLYIDGGQEPLTHALWGAQFYIAGILTSRLAIPFKLKMIPVYSLLLVAGVVFSNASLFQYAYLFLLFFIAFHWLNAKGNILHYVGQNTMGIYLLHSPLIIKVSTVATDMLSADPVVIFVINVLSIFSISIIAVHFLRWVGLGKYLFGEWRPTNK